MSQAQRQTKLVQLLKDVGVFANTERLRLVEELAWLQIVEKSSGMGQMKNAGVDASLTKTTNDILDFFK